MSETEAKHEGKERRFSQEQYDMLLDEADAKVSVFDHGLLYGDGVFEGIRVYGNDRVFLSCAPPGETGG